MANPNQLDLDRIMRALVREATGLGSDFVMPGNENSPAPNTPYATVLRITEIQDGIDSTRYRAIPNNDTQVTAITTGCRSDLYSIQFYREGAYDLARTCRQYIHTPLGELFLQTNNISWRRSSEVRQIDGIISDKWEQRAGFDAEIRFIQTVEQTVNIIENTNINVKLDAETTLEEDFLIHEP